MNETAKKVWAGGWSALFHFLGTVTVTTLLSLPGIDWTRVVMLWEASTIHGFDFDWIKGLLHFGLGACLWALLVIGYLLVDARRKENRKKVVLKSNAGTVMTETLIVFPFVLLLTSGLAQLALLNLTGMLADLAVFNGARAAWVWCPEQEAPRFNRLYNNHARIQAMTASAFALAPTAPNDRKVGMAGGSGSSEDFRHNRSILSGAFMADGTNGMSASSTSFWQGALDAGGGFGLSGQANSSTDKQWQYVSAFDTTEFRWRSARKVTMALWGLGPYGVDGGGSPYNVDCGDDTVRVQFTYYYEFLFPWFQYIWGEQATLDGTYGPGYYALIERQHSITAQPSME